MLSLIIWSSILGGVVTLLVGDERCRKVALGISIFAFVCSMLVYFRYDASSAAMQLTEFVAWLPSFGINYSLGVDGISVPLIVLTTFINVIVVISAWEVIEDKPAMYLASFLIMTGLMVGVFAATDSILFYIFFEATLIPMFLIIGIWGGPRRVYATIKFFLYTFLGSVFMLVALIYMGSKAGSFAIQDLYALPLASKPQILIFLAFFVAFAVKIPMWPVHTWLPDAHVEAPTAGSAVLAAIMLKMGGYGFMRFSMPVVPDASAQLAWLVILFSLIAVVYIGFVALAQSDMKKLIAYSSISHMGFVTLGMFVIFKIVASEGGDGGVQQLVGDSHVSMALEGAMVQMISHGFISAAMFLCVGCLYDRMHSRQIADYGGVVNTMPVFAAFMVFFAMANAGLPGTSGFVGEFMVILAAFKANFWFAFLAASTLILGAAYTLWMIKRVVFGDVANENVAALTDINRREKWMLGILAAMVLLFGLWPNPLVEVMHVSIENLVQHVTTSKL